MNRSNRVLAIHYARCSAIAYRDKATKEELKELGYSKAKLISFESAQCMIFENTKEITLAFRGTEPTQVKDVIADLKAWKHKSQITVGKVHDGFYDELKKIWDEITTYINKGKAKDKTLHITGHSLGGGMATIAASRLKNRVKNVYTYGSPRVGNKRWVNVNSDFNYQRFVNNNDIVPKVPLWIMGYRHCGKLQYINYYGDFRSATFWQRTKDGLRGRWAAAKQWSLLDGLSDHSINHYINKLENPIPRK
jgi:triacylglycerol lipase